MGFTESMNAAMANPLTWIYTCMGLAVVIVLLLILIIVIFRKTHAGVELSGWLTKKQIAMFFQENRYVEWKPVKPSCGLVEDKNYGTFIINDRATYVDKLTKNIILPFDANFGAGVNIHSAKLADDLQYVMKDEEQMKMFRTAVAHNMIDDSASIEGIKTTVNIGAIKNMMTALIPHNINAKIQFTIASRMKQFGNVNGMQILLIFGGMLGAIVIGYLIIKSVGGSSK